MAKTDVWSNFVKADAPDKHRIVGLSMGEPGSRKTSFWLEAPGPIVVFSFDQGLEGVVERYQKDKDIYVAEYEWAPDPTKDESYLQDQAIDIRDKFSSDFKTALENARTVVLDKETDLWELFRYAEFGKPNNSPRDYPALNQRYRKLINMAKSSDVNFGCIDGLKSEWVSKTNPKTGAQGAAASGQRIRAGFSELEGLVHVVLHHQGIGSEDWTITVGKSRGPGGHEIAGQTLSGLTFQDFATLVFPDSELEEWV